MNPSLNQTTDHKQIRFTPSGKMYVIDAIVMLTETDLPKELWNNLKSNKPEIIQYVDYHRCHDKTREPVTDSAGLNKIQTFLFDYLVEIGKM